jgi:hypothetical protein
VAAAVAVGDIADVESLGDLKRLAANPETVFNLRWRALESLRKLGMHLKQQRPDAAEIGEIVAVFRGVLEDERERSHKIIREALTGYGAFCDAAGAAVFFPRLAESQLNIDGIVAVLKILTRHPQDAYEVVSAYLRWRADNQRLPDVPESPDRALDGFCLYMQASDGYEAAGKAVAAALARAQADMPDQVHREIAQRLLADFLLADDAPAIDPAADAAARTAQFQQWQQWWQRAQDGYSFTAGGDLGRPSPTP